MANQHTVGGNKMPPPQKPYSGALIVSEVITSRGTGSLMDKGGS